MEISLDINYTLNSKNYKFTGETPNNTELEYDNLIWLDERDKPTWIELNILFNNLKENLLIIYCKDTAKRLISACDWSVLPDVKIQNKSDFENYRAILRNYILNPVENPNFPEEPQPIWIQ